MYYHIYSSQSYIFVQNFSANHRNSKKTTTFAFNKRSVTYLRKCPITQHIVSDSGHSTKGLKRGGTTRICNTMKYSGLHLSPHSVYLSKQRLYRLKWMVADNQWCKYAASESSERSVLLILIISVGKMVYTALMILLLTCCLVNWRNIIKWRSLWRIRKYWIIVARVSLKIRMGWNTYWK